MAEFAQALQSVCTHASHEARSALLELRSANQEAELRIATLQEEVQTLVGQLMRAEQQNREAEVRLMAHDGARVVEDLRTEEFLQATIEQGAHLYRYTAAPGRCLVIDVTDVET